MPCLFDGGQGLVPCLPSTFWYEVFGGELPITIVITGRRTRTQDLVMDRNWSTYTGCNTTPTSNATFTCRKKESGNGPSLGCAVQEENDHSKGEK